MAGSVPSLTILVGEPALAAFNLAEDFTVTAVQITWHPPYVDGRKTAKRANVHGRRVGAAGVWSPVAPVTEDGDPAGVHIDALRDVDIHVTEGRQDHHRRARMADRGVAQIEVEVAAGGRGADPPAQPEPSAPHDMTAQGDGQAGRSAPRTGDAGEIFLDTRQFAADTGPEGSLNPVRELVKG